MFSGCYTMRERPYLDAPGVKMVRKVCKTERNSVSQRGSLYYAPNDNEINQRICTNAAIESAVQGMKHSIQRWRIWPLTLLRFRIISETTNPFIYLVGLLASQNLSLHQRFSTLSNFFPTFTLAYRLAGPKVTNKGNLLKLHDNLLKMVLTCYCK